MAKFKSRFKSSKEFKQQKKTIDNTLKAHKNKKVRITDVPTYRVDRLTGRYTTPTNKTATVTASHQTATNKLIGGPRETVHYTYAQAAKQHGAFHMTHRAISRRKH